METFTVVVRFINRATGEVAEYYTEHVPSCDLDSFTMCRIVRGTITRAHRAGLFEDSPFTDWSIETELRAEEPIEFPRAVPIKM